MENTGQGLSAAQHGQMRMREGLPPRAFNFSNFTQPDRRCRMYNRQAGSF